MERRANAMRYEFEPATQMETNFRHSAWHEKRKRVRATLIALGIRETKLWNFDQCGSCCTVEWSKSENRHRLRSNTCKCRHCEPCMRQRANRMAANLKERLAREATGNYRFITLTLKHSTAPLGQQIKRIYKCFRKLRGSKLWKCSQNGGCHVLEVKWQAKTKRWHVHLHIISDGCYIQKSDLVANWKKITGDSFIVDIRQLKSGKDAAHYVAKYVSKGTSSEVWADLNASQEWVTATKGVRICATWGSWRGFKLMAIKKTTDDWQCIARLSTIIEASANCENWATAILLSLRPPGGRPEVGLRDKSP